MRKTWALFLILCVFFFGSNLFAQEETSPGDGAGVEQENPSGDSEWTAIVSAPYTTGDKTFVITPGVVFPTYFGGGNISGNQHGLAVGGGFLSLAMNYFLNPNFFVGAELGAMYTPTRGENNFYIIPFGVRAGYQFSVGRFEFPISLFAGGARQMYLGEVYFGPFAKPSVSAFFRYSQNWSFGLNGAWWFVPQWPKNGYTVYGNFLELTLSARYHF